MKGKLFNFMLAAALMASASATFVSCKDTESDDYQSFEYKLNDLNSTFADKLKTVDEQIAALQTKLNSIKSCDCNEQQVRDLISALTTRVTNLETASTSQVNTIEDLRKRIVALEGQSDDTSWKSQIEDINKRLDNLKNSTADTTTVNNLTRLYNELTDKVNKGATAAQVEDLLKRIQTLEGQKDDTSWKSQIEEINRKLTNLQSQISSGASSAEIDAIKSRLDALEKLSDDTTWKQQIADINKKLENLPADDTSWKGLIDQINNETLPALRNDLVEKINAADAAAKEAKTAAAEAQRLAGEADSKAGAAQQNAQAAKEAADQAKQLANSLYDKANADIEGVKSDLKDLQQATVDLAASLITEVIVQSTESPAVGELAVPLDVQANMLVTYYGENKSGETYRFPTKIFNDAYVYSSDESVFNQLDEYTLPGAKATVPTGTLLAKDGKEGNAGKLYITVNPSTVDVSGTDFSLQNSQGKSYDILGSATKSDKVLTWGWTRAASENFYEVPATIKESDLDTYKLTLNTSRVREAVKKLVKERSQTKVALKELAKSGAQLLYNNMSTNLPRLAVAKEYIAKVGDNQKTLKNVGEMNILAGAFKPVGFGELDAANDVKGIPGLETVERRLTNFIDGIKLDPVKINVNATKINKVRNVGDLKRKDNQHFTIDVSYTYYDKDGKEQQGNSNVNIDNQIDDLLKIVNDTLTAANNNAVNQFNSAVDAVNQLIDDLQDGVDVNTSVSSTKAELSNRVTNYLDDISDRYAYWFNRAKNSALHLCMLYNGTDGIHRLRGGYNTITGSSITLVPTTYTYELFAPAYKKYVTVLGENMSGTNLSEVLDGDVRSVTINGLQSGKTYKILYEAVDYTGKISAKIYTVTVK